MSHLLLQDTNRCADFRKSCEITVALGEAEIAKILTFVENFKEEDLALYKA